MYHGELSPRPGAEQYETALLWRLEQPVRGTPRELRCTAEHLGEDFFELCLVAGDELLLSEPYDDIEELISAAQRLRARIEAQGAIP